MSRRTALLLPAVLALAIFLPGIGRDDFLHEDEYRNSVMVREQLASGPELHPRLHQERYPDYPPLYFWVALVPARMQGAVTPLAVRLPSLVGAIAFAVGTALLALRFERSPRTALAAGCLAATLPGFCFEARRAMIDPLFAGLATMAVALFASTGRERAELLSTRATRFLAGSLFLGLAWLTKGPLAAVCVGVALAGGEALAIALASDDRRDDAKLTFRRAVLVTLVVLAIAALWFGATWKLAGEEYARNLLELQTWGRFRHQVQHQKPFSYFLVRTIPLLLPATAFAWGEVVALVRGRSRARLAAFALGWFALGLLFFSLSKTKRSYYTMPIYPAMALLAARFLARRDPWIATCVRWVASALAVVGLLAPLAGLYDPTLAGVGFALALSFLLGAAAAFALAPRNPALALAAAIAFSFAGANQVVLPRASERFGHASLARALVARGFARDRLAVSPGGVHREALCWELAPSPVTGLVNVLNEPGHELADPEAVLAWLRQYPPGEAAVIVRPKDLNGSKGVLDELANPEVEKIAGSENETEDLVAIALRRKKK